MRIITVLPIFTIKPYEAGIFEFLGKYSRFTGPGLKVMIPFLHTCKIRDIREHTMDVPPQSVITKDNVEIMVDGVIWAKPRNTETDIKKTFYDIDSWTNAVMQLAMANLRQEFGRLTLDESLVSREPIANSLKMNLDTTSDDWGVNVSKVEIRLIDPPQDIKEAMHKQKTAEQERRAMRLLATGKFEAAQQEKLGAIQRAEGEKESTILKAEGKKMSKIRVAEGEAERIRMVNEAAQKYFVGPAQEMRRLEVTENSLKVNSKIVLTEKGISPQVIIGNIPTTK